MRNALQGSRTGFHRPAQGSRSCGRSSTLTARLSRPRRAVEPRGGTARHTRRLGLWRGPVPSMGMDILQQTEVTGRAPRGRSRHRRRHHEGSESLRQARHRRGGTFGASWPERAGFRLTKSNPSAVQAWFREPIQPVMDVVVMAKYRAGYYDSQSTRGEMGHPWRAEAYNNYKTSAAAFTMSRKPCARWSNLSDDLAAQDAVAGGAASSNMNRRTARR